MKYPAYTAYKESGVEWLGKVPKHWEVKRGRFVMRVNPPAEKLRALNVDDEISFIPMEAVGVWGGLNLEQSRIIGDVSGGYSEFQNGDVVVAKITPCFENGKGALAAGLLNGAAYGTTELHVLRSGRLLDRRFLFYLSISDTFRQLGKAEMFGAGGQKRVPPEFNKDFRMPLPPLSEQSAIADFLDAQTEKIDTLMTKKRTFIDKLKEKRTALISHTVTRGLPPDAAKAAGLNPKPKLKPSGVEWLGDVPEHWEVKKVKHLVSVRGRIGYRGYTTDDLVLEGDGALALGATHITDTGQLDLSSPIYISWFKYYESPEIMVASNDILVVQRGSTCGKVGIINAQLGPATINPSLVVLKNVNIESKFLFYSLRSAGTQGILANALSATAIPMLSQEQIGDLYVSCPSQCEQQAIVRYLDLETSQIDRMIEKIELAIEKLQEYRTALITAAVTGKIDVRSCKKGSLKSGGSDKI